MRWPAGVLTVLAVAATVSGCAGNDHEGNTTPGIVWTHYVDLPHGGHVLCVWEKDGYGGGLSCDWQGARQ